MDECTNSDVDDAVRGVVRLAVDRVLGWTVFNAVRGALHWAVGGAVDWAVDWAVRRTVYSECPHPGLQDFLINAKVEV
jgi:hypothetical protein